ncbi:MAG: hypothetical protein OYH77_04850 [Pseudomonadota bacterium]|nr:hypothetical protein [Pseudomonadota bacterium]
MITRSLFCVLLVSLLATNTAVGITVKPATKQPTKSVGSRVVSKVGQGLVVGATALVMLCSQVGCGSDNPEATALVEDTVADTPDVEVEIEQDFHLHDYIGHYAAFIQRGNGEIASGLVINTGRHSNELIVVYEPQKQVWAKNNAFDDDDVVLLPIGGQVRVPMQVIVGVMDNNHEQVGALVEFDPADARSPLHLAFDEPRHGNDDWGDDVFILADLAKPTRVLGKIRTVYVEPTHSQDARPTVVSVIVQFGFSAKKWRQLHQDDAYVLYDALKFVDQE